MPNIFGLDLSPLLDGIKTAVGGMVGESSAQPRDPFQGYQPQGTDPFAGLTYTGSSGSYQPQGHDPFAGWQGGGSDPFAGLSYGTMGSTFASNDPNQSFGANPLFAAFDQAHQNKLGFLASEEAKKASIGKGVVVGAGAAGGGGPSAGDGAWTGQATAADNAALTPTQIDNWIAKTVPQSPLKGMGGFILGYANQRNVSVPEALAIFWKESALATTAGDAWNIAGVGGEGGFHRYPTLEDAVRGAIDNLASDLYRGKSVQDHIGYWFVGPQKYAQQGLDATDSTGGRYGTVRDYLTNYVAPVYQGLGVPLNPTAPQQRAPQAGSGGMMASIWGGGNAPINQDYGVVDPSVPQSIYTYGAAYGLAQGHTGLDIGLKRGSQLYMPAGLTGVVETAGGTPYFRDEDYGDAGTPGKGELRIRLSNGDILIMGHTSAINVGVGQQVTGGTALGQSGSASGDHLHLEYRRRNADGSYTLVDPRTVLGSA